MCVGAGKELSKQQQHILKGIESIVAHAFFVMIVEIVEKSVSFGLREFYIMWLSYIFIFI